jgi:hypothetical protein
MTAQQIPANTDLFVPMLDSPGDGKPFALYR